MKMNVLVIEFAPDHWLRICSERTKRSRFWLATTMNSSASAVTQDRPVACCCSVLSWFCILSISEKTIWCSRGKFHSLPSDLLAFSLSPILQRYRGLSSHKNDKRSRSPATIICMLCGTIHCLGLLSEMCNEVPHAEKYWSN